MKISPSIYKNNINFSARKKEIREADKIARKSREVFPMLSQTYIDTFYKTAKDTSPNSINVIVKSNEMFRQIDIMRDLAKYPDEYNIEIPELEKNTLYAINLNGIKQMKIGNCQENAMAAVATLCANGYTNSERADLVYKIDFINKETKEIEDTTNYPLDHAFAITDMNKGGKQDIVIDPWLGFADSKSGAIARFKQMYDEKDYKKALAISTTLFCCGNKMTKKEFEEKYEVKAHMDFVSQNKYTTTYEKKRLGEYALMMYNNILINKHKQG